MLLLQSDADAACDEALFPTSPCWFCLHPSPFPRQPLCPCNPASGTECVLTQTSEVWGEEQEQLLTHELCPRSHLRGRRILLCTAFHLKHSSLCTLLGYSQVHSALSCQEPVLFQIFPHTCLFASLLRNVNNRTACFYKVLITTCHRA